MTDIKGLPQVPQTPTSKVADAGSMRGDLTQGQTQHDWKDRKHQQDGGAHRSKSSVFVSQSALEARVAALQSDARTTGREKTEDEDAPETSEQVLVSLEAAKPAAIDPAGIKETASADRMSKSETLANLIAGRMDSALRSGPVVSSGPVSLMIGLEPQTGLSGVQITLSDGVLAVVLVRGAGAADQTLQMAALNLAQILQTRFPTRQIRISEKTDAIDTPEAAGKTDQAQSGFAHLFQTGRDVT